MQDLNRLMIILVQIKNKKNVLGLYYVDIVCVLFDSRTRRIIATFDCVMHSLNHWQWHSNLLSETKNVIEAQLSIKIHSQHRNGMRSVQLLTQEHGRFHNIFKLSDILTDQELN